MHKRFAMYSCRFQAAQQGSAEEGSNHGCAFTLQCEKKTKTRTPPPPETTHHSKSQRLREKHTHLGTMMVSMREPAEALREGGAEGAAEGAPPAATPPFSE